MDVAITYFFLTFVLTLVMSQFIYCATVLFSNPAIPQSSPFLLLPTLATHAMVHRHIHGYNSMCGDFKGGICEWQSVVTVVAHGSTWQHI